MKKHIPILFISIPSIVVSTIAISSCSCNINPGYVAIPTDYLKIENNKLLGFKDPEADLSKYDTLQVPSNVTSVSGFIYEKGHKAYKAIKQIIGADNGKWTTIEDGAFSQLPNLTKIVLPKTISSIGLSAFDQLPKLDTIDLSNIQDITIIKSEYFKGSADPSKQINNGTIIVKNNDDKTALANTLTNNDWLKGWKIEIKNSNV